MTRAKSESLLRPKQIAVSIAACFALHAAQLQANPTGPTVVHGGVGFSGLGTSALTITNQAGGNAVINWNGFSIGVNELTKFQQFANLAVLNRVTGNELSSILGALQSDGRVFLINPNGIVFGASARVDVAGMVASSLNLSDQDFLANRLRFTEVPGAGAVVNNGVIQTAAGGRVYMVAPSVENNGLIQSPQGAIVLAAGREIELVDANSPYLTVKVAAAADSAVNVGNLVADSGRIGMFGALVRNAGTVAANGAVAGPGGEIRLVASKDLTLEAGSLVAANGTSGGSVLLQAEGGTNIVAGTVEAKGSAGAGGEVNALGVRVGVVGHGVIDASGDTGGGTVLVGGDYQGKNAAVQNAERTYIGSDGVIRADAMTTGDGGRVIVWADGDTRFNGNISAKGGAQAGDGGFAEVSGKQYLDYRGRADLTTPAGKIGTLLLDPQDITIVYGSVATNPDITEVAGSPFTFTSNGAIYGVTTLTDGSINAQLALSNVVVQTGGSATNAGDITFDASGGIFLSSGLASSNLSFDATRNISVVNGTTNVFLNGGQLSLRAQSGSITSATENDVLALTSTPLLLIAGSGIGSSAVPLQTNDVTDLAAVSGSNGIYIKNGAFSTVNVTSLGSSDLSGSPFVEGLRTSNAEISLATIQLDGGGSIGLQAQINSGAARTTLIADEQIYSYYGGGPSIVAEELVMSAANGIGCGQCGDGRQGAQHPLQTQVTSLQATNTFSGIEIHNIGSVTLKDLDGSGYAIESTNGSAIVSSTGNITVADSVNAGRLFRLVADGSLFVSANVSGGPSGEGGRPSELIADANDDGSGSISQGAASTIVSNNQLEISIVCSFGCEQGSSSAGSGQHVTLGTVDAGGSEIQIRNEKGGIFSNGSGLITASDLMLRAEQGINLDTGVSRLEVRHAVKGGTGSVTIRNNLDGGTLFLESFFNGRSAIENGGGAITVSNDGSIHVVNDVDSGTARTTLSSGDEIRGDGGTIFAGELVVSAVNGVGACGGECGNTLLTQIGSLQATNTNLGIEIENTGDLTLKAIDAAYAVNNAQGGLNIRATGNITVANAVNAGRRIGLYADGDLVLNANLAANTSPARSTAPESELFADNNADGVGSIISAPGAGNVTTNGSSLFAQGQSVSLGGINADAAIAGNSGGNVTIMALGPIAIGGGISARGANGDSSNVNGGQGGSINLTTSGPITVSGAIDASGGAGSASVYGGFGGAGGYGGSVTISGAAVSTGAMLARGGDGGASMAYGSTPTIGGDGGAGGSVSAIGSGEVQVNAGGTLGAAAIDVSGGAGGRGNDAASPAGAGGAGGAGGSVSVIGTPNMTLFGSVNAAGGAGGAGGTGNASFAGGVGGAGGNAGTIFLDASSVTGARTGDGIIFVLAGTQFNVQGGAGGAGGADLGGGAGVGGAAGVTKTFISMSDFFGTIVILEPPVILDPLSLPEVNSAFQQTIDGSDDSTVFVGGEDDKDKDEDKSKKEFGSCKG